MFVSFRRLCQHFVALLAFLLLASPALAGGHGHGHKRPQKTGILLVAFGSTIEPARKAYDVIEAQVRAAYPDVPVRWAYTSKMVRHKLADGGLNVDSPAMALARMADENFTNVAVQTLHVIPGQEYHGLMTTAGAFEGLPKGLERVLRGYPLCATHEGTLALTRAILDVAPKLKKREALVLMGHGTHHPGNVYYPALQYYFEQTADNVFVGTVEGYPALDDVLAKLKKRGIKKAYLMPLMAVAGDHARNDMAGPESDSWKSVLEAGGIVCEPLLKGLGEYPEIAALWVRNLQNVMSHF